uniref:S-adenosylmethionine:tRNA ribosyltransferase-isomerase-like protein n=1 Tax=uncultured Nocardioidaceae bacterium TaxID=253824 RepID=A0A6J4L2Q6_9ACTN|nr:MAG: S-adenosylmethionine:tRNA ribosyltransferase-isomerase-like protein [uncultured Nocardioidaceae bacterium]
MTAVTQSRAEAQEPAEARGLARDEVRMLVAAPGRLEHTRVRALPQVLEPGDLLVVNTSATLPAALDAVRADGRLMPLHVGGELDDGRWVVELRLPDQTGPSRDATPGEPLQVGSGVVLVLEAPYPDAGETAARLWTARPTRSVSRLEHLWHHGRAVAYSYLERSWSLSDRQTIFATEPGSAEMPSAGRPFTERLVTDLVAAGVVLAPVTLHCGLSSPEAHELPVPERFRVPPATARLVNETRAAGRRVLAVGTTVVRALESALTTAGRRPRVSAASGWTDLVLGPDHPARVVDGLLTGLHDPEASHLMLLEAVAGKALVDDAYGALADGAPDGGHYLRHEFGDTTLLLP